jgi:CheY-like chemotaxis protein
LAEAAGTSLVALQDLEVSELAVRLVPEQLARRHLAVPLQVDNRTLTYATCRPFNVDAARDLEYTSGRHAKALVATRSGVLETLERWYSKAGDASPEPAHADVKRPQPTDRVRILLADDEPITRMLARILLEREKFQVFEAENGFKAIEVATRERPDLLLIDLNMPELDGYGAIRRIRQDPSLAYVPIVVVTAEDDPGVERRVLDLGADDYLIKPFEPAVLLARVNAVFRRMKVMAA